MAVPKKSNPLELPEEIRGLKSFEAEFTKALGKLRDNPDLAAEVAQAQVGNPINVEIVPSVDRWAGNQLAGSAAAGDKWLRGVQNPSASPLEAAKRAAGKYKQRMTESLTEDRWLKSLNRITEEDIVSVATRIGAAGYTQGIAAREDKIRRAIAELQPKAAALKRTLDQMPQDTDAQREAKMIAAKRGMQAIGKELRGIASGGR